MYEQVAKLIANIIDRMNLNRLYRVYSGKVCFFTLPYMTMVFHLTLHPGEKLATDEGGKYYELWNAQAQYYTA